MSQHATNTNADRHKLTCHHCRKPGQYRNQCHRFKKQSEQAEKLKIFQETETVASKNLTQTTKSTLTTTTTTTTKKVTEPKESQKGFTHPVRHAERKTTAQTCFLGANAVSRPPLWQRRPEGQNQAQDRTNPSDSNEVSQAAAQNLN